MFLSRFFAQPAISRPHLGSIHEPQYSAKPQPGHTTKPQPSSPPQSESLSKSHHRSLRLVLFESAITAGNLAVPILTPFYHSIGLTQFEIAATQAIFTLIVLLIDFPTGWLADRFGRKWANVIGDFGAALAYFCYSRSTSFFGVVSCECLLGFFLAFSEGVDYSLLKHFSNQIAPGETYFRQQNVRLAFWRQACSLMLILLGGPIGAISFRLAIACTGLIYLIGGIASLGIYDDSERLSHPTASPLLDMVRIAVSALRRRDSRFYIFTYAVSREMTHGIIWVFTPMLLAAGLPLSIVSMGWAINSLCCIVGVCLAKRFAPRLSTRQILTLPFILMVISMTALSIRINLWTISLYLLMGVVQGWTATTVMPRLQECVPASEQTSVISLAKVIAKLLYIPVVCLIGIAADFSLNYAALVTLIIFLPLGLLLLRSFQE